MSNLDQITITNLNFTIRQSLLGGEYKSLRLPDREITVEIDDLGNFVICLCTPYEEEKDQKKQALGAGMVVREWKTYNEEKVYEIVTNYCLTNEYFEYLKQVKVKI